ncbi:MAG: sigma 54-interacting transcriptional regulator [Deltaproteobacteria bacterium]|nr:sigma 54-interacting transcriptional regulator [Deltaproteobacteria bacterium]
MGVLADSKADTNGMAIHLAPRGRAQRNGFPGVFTGELNDLAELFKLTLDSVYSGTIVCDKHSRILYMNRFYADLLGVDREEAVGRHIMDFFPSSRVPSVIDSGRAELGARCTLRAAIDLVVNRIPIKADGETIGVVLQTVFRSYTEVNELMKRLNSLEKRVVQYKRGLDSMLSATYTFDSIVGESKGIVEAKQLAEKYARTDAAVLIMGATGTGKELFAHSVHLASDRRDGPFVCVNCAAIPRDLLESELFGYEAGAFTGARQKGKAGKIELADRGTLFLDEIGDIPANAQAKLLRVLESKKIERLGGVKAVSVDFRLVAATHRDLKSMIKREEFREDLFYRVNTMTVEVPDLSAREEDIPLLVEHFLDAVSERRLYVSPEALSMLERYPWPGNVRELRSAVERAVTLADGVELEPAHFPTEIQGYAHNAVSVREKGVQSLAKSISTYEKEVLSKALAATGGNMSRTARLLGISRSTL